MTRILAIDPGSSESGYVVADSEDSGLPRVLDADRVTNEVLLRDIRSAALLPPDGLVLVEWTAPRGMPASAQLFETMWWAGRLAEAAYPLRVERIPRAEVKRRLCGRTSAKDTNVRQALIDLYGGTGGKLAAVGLKRSPGPLYGVKADAWSALALVVVYPAIVAERRSGSQG